MSNITIFAAADYSYFLEHGLPFARSANKVGHRCLIYIFPDIQKNIDEETRKIIEFFTHTFYKDIDPEMTEVRMIPHTVMKNIEQNNEVIDRRSMFASIRFIMLPDVLQSEYDQNGNSVLVLDIDSVVNKPVKIPKKYQAGIFLRENENLGQNDWERMGMKVAAGALYVTMRADLFVETFSNLLVRTPMKWFNDQVALYQAYNAYKEYNKFIIFDNKFLNWDFEDKNAIIYTGKGARKDSDAYKKLREEIIKKE